MTDVSWCRATRLGNRSAGDGAPLPRSVLQLVPHVGTVGLPANPLKSAGAALPLSEFSFDHWAPQNVTELPTALFRSPMPKAENLPTVSKRLGHAQVSTTANIYANDRAVAFIQRVLTGSQAA